MSTSSQLAVITLEREIMSFIRTYLRAFYHEDHFYNFLAGILDPEGIVVATALRLCYCKSSVVFKFCILPSGLINSNQ